MFRIDGKHSNPVSCKESSTHSPIKRSVPINVDLQFHVNHLQVTHLILHSSQKQQEGRDSWGERTLRKTSGIHYPGSFSTSQLLFYFLGRVLPCVIGAGHFMETPVHKAELQSAYLHYRKSFVMYKDVMC